MKSILVGAAVLMTVSAIALPARAHISIISGAAVANTTQEITFGVAHGCAGADTNNVRIEIPSGLTSVRPERSDFGKVAVEKNAAGDIIAVSWQKADADALDADIAYYKLIVRAKVPDQAFSTLFFRAHQTCRAADGTMSTVDWVTLPTDPVVDGGADEPAAALPVMPAKLRGWNKYVVPAAVPDLSPLFGDALIVWRGTAAYSANPNTTALIGSTSGVSALSALAAGDEIWVKY